MRGKGRATLERLQREPANSRSMAPQRRGTFQRGKRGLVCFPGHLGSATFRTDRRSHCLRVFKTDGATLLRLTSPKTVHLQAACKVR